MHRRLRPKVHAFSYRIFMFWLDLDELAEISQRTRLFRSERAGLYSFRNCDYFSIGRPTARENAVAFLRRESGCEEPASVRLLTLPRFLGYTFNPISIFFFFDAGESEPFASLVQVGNTFGELKPYVVPKVAKGPAPFHRRVTKEFYVSPFSDLDLEFDFRIDAPGDRLKILIDDYRDGEKELVSSLTGRRKELNFANLAWFTVKYPFITLKVIGLIHWEAFRLWLKRVPYHRKEANPHLQKNVHRPHKSLE